MSKLKLIQLRGCPATGKSTWAKEFAKENNNYVIVNRDSIRLSARGYYDCKSIEDYVTLIEEESVKGAFQKGLSVILDATNLNPKYNKKWEDIAKSYDAEMEIKEFFISMGEAIERDKKRGEDGGVSVGKKVIERFYKTYYPDEYNRATTKTDTRKIKDIDFSKKLCVLCDLDGTLSLSQGRNPFDYKKAEFDKCDTRLRTLLETISSANVEFIFVSGREATDECVEATYKFLAKNVIGGALHVSTVKEGKNYKTYGAGSTMLGEHSIYMRSKGDFRGDEIVKKELYETFIEPNYSVLAVFDDRNKVVNMWRELGILCCQVYDGDF